MSRRIDWADYDAVLFDLDGVITPTAEVHERAWAELFSDFDYTPDDYLAHIDGRPRYDGVRAFLHSRGIELPEGHPTDAPGGHTICAHGEPQERRLQRGAWIPRGSPRTRGRWR